MQYEALQAVHDWSGGTRIGPCLEAFHRHWARRVLPGHATVLLITDGLERGDTAALATLDAQMALLARRCRRLLWLNPLMRWRDFEPRAAGMRVMLPHVQRFLPAHHLASLEQLVDVLAGDRPPTPPRLQECGGRTALLACRRARRPSARPITPQRRP